MGVLLRNSPARSDANRRISVQMKNRALRISTMSPLKSSARPPRPCSHPSARRASPARRKARQARMAAARGRHPAFPCYALVQGRSELRLRQRTRNACSISALPVVSAYCLRFRPLLCVCAVFLCALRGFVAPVHRPSAPHLLLAFRLFCVSVWHRVSFLYFHVYPAIQSAKAGGIRHCLLRSLARLPAGRPRLRVPEPQAALTPPPCRLPRASARATGAPAPAPLMPVPLAAGGRV